MKKIFILLLLIAVSCKAQNKKEADFKEFISYFKKEIKTPIDFKKDWAVKRNDTIPILLYNKIIFGNQSKKYAQCYDPNGNLFSHDYTEYSPLDTTPTNLTPLDGIEIKYYDKAYPIGYLKFDENFIGLIVRIATTSGAFIDLYLFDMKGNLKSFVGLYADESILLDDFKRVYTEENDTKYKKSSIEKEKIIKQFRFLNGVSKWIDWQLQPDGYFKPIKYKEEGKNWWADE
ncbi:MAG: hypothetical protein Q4C98_10860 [Capnocytophaga sp.]|nr:hypothetical protein [Capnocytophaga sp.]